MRLLFVVLQKHFLSCYKNTSCRVTKTLLVVLQETLLVVLQETLLVVLQEHLPQGRRFKPDLDRISSEIVKLFEKIRCYSSSSSAQKRSPRHIYNSHFKCVALECGIICQII